MRAQLAPHASGWLRPCGSTPADRRLDAPPSWPQPPSAALRPPGWGVRAAPRASRSTWKRSMSVSNSELRLPYQRRRAGARRGVPAAKLIERLCSSVRCGGNGVTHSRGPRAGSGTPIEGPRERPPRRASGCVRRSRTRRRCRSAGISGLPRDRGCRSGCCRR
jgi:hypothetical protein